MNILFIKPFFVGFMVSEIPRVSVFGHCPYSVTFTYITCVYLFNFRCDYLKNKLYKFTKYYNSCTFVYVIYY